ncbi:RNA polymerase sigma factor [Sphingopyxis sp.]|uniref:RNA polymerase sigma factor n=1 Tax=Sphingopyxis sp. TaxID=1908224 RepID=UPI002E090A46|nr:RNA polymerase sigma factor [Sphingopyxis sp.]
MPSSFSNSLGAECTLLPDSSDSSALSADPPRFVAPTSRSECQLGAAYREHGGALLGFLRRKAGAEEAPDLVQEVFARAASSAQCGKLSNPGGFLRRIAQNLLIDRARHSRNHRPLPHPFDEQRDAACDPQQEWRLEADDLLGLYERAVDTMPFKTRRVFLMHRVDELSYREIHERLGITIATVEYHMMRALAHIANALGVER